MKNNGETILLLYLFFCLFYNFNCHKKLIDNKIKQKEKIIDLKNQYNKNFIKSFNELDATINNINSNIDFKKLEHQILEKDISNKTNELESNSLNITMIDNRTNRTAYEFISNYEKYIQKVNDEMKKNETRFFEAKKKNLRINQKDSNDSFVLEETPVQEYKIFDNLNRIEYRIVVNKKYIPVYYPLKIEKHILIPERVAVPLPQRILIPEAVPYGVNIKNPLIRESSNSTNFNITEKIYDHIPIFHHFANGKSNDDYKILQEKINKVNPNTYIKPSSTIKNGYELFSNLINSNKFKYASEFDNKNSITFDNAFPINSNITNNTSTINTKIETFRKNKNLSVLKLFK